MRLRALALGITASLIAAACGGATTTGPSATPAATTAATTAPTKGPAAKVNLMVGGLNKQIYLASKLTEALGYFKDENVDVSLIDEPSGTDTETEVLAGTPISGRARSTTRSTCNLRARSSRASWCSSAIRASS